MFGQMNGIGGVFGAADDPAARYGADMKPLPIGSSVPIGVNPAAPPRRDVIGENIFGGYVYSHDAVETVAEHPWGQVSSEVPAPIPPGAPLPALGPRSIDHSVPVSMDWQGQGIFGGKMHHGRYGTYRDGQPVSGLGAIPTDPTQYSWAEPSGAKHYCAYLATSTTRAGQPGPANLWDTRWPCQSATDYNNVWGAINAWLAANPGKSSADWFAGQRDGSIPPPPGMPSIKESNTMLYVGVGLASAALIGGAFWYRKRQKKAG